MSSIGTPSSMVWLTAFPPGYIRIFADDKANCLGYGEDHLLYHLIKNVLQMT